MRSGLLVFVIVGVLLAGGAGRLAFLEETRGTGLRQRADEQQTAMMTISAQRGDILDSRGRVLAGSVRRPSIKVDPALVDDVAFASHSIAPVVGMRPQDLEQLILERKDRRFAWVKRLISQAELEAFNKVRRARRLHAFTVENEPKRTYPFERLAAAVIGFVGAEHHGMAGIEQTFDQVLAGRDGTRTMTVDVRRRRLRSQEDEYVAPRDGASIVLTIDAYIQQRAEHHLRKAYEEFKPHWAVAVVMDPTSGEVLAMATLPDFDPVDPLPPGISPEQALEVVRNRAIADAYEPGSIFKPFVASCALDDHLTRLDEVFVINGPTRSFGRRTINDTHPYDQLQMLEVISKSSNIGMALLGGRLGNARLHEYVRRFGFGDVTGIDLPGEHTGQINDFSRWTSYSTQSIPIGQEISVTAVQVLTAFSVFANDGVLYRPRVVRGIVSAEGETLADHSEPVPIRRVLDASMAREFRMSALVEVIRSGTGKVNGQLPKHQAFGKTGTAQIARGRSYAASAYVGSFVAGAPASAPRAVAIVSIYHPTTGKYYGGTVAAPAVAGILADTLDYMQVPPDAQPSALPSALPGEGGW